ncbi:MAG: hypothetical protein ABIJ09_26255 [Pseudomonadota bacterium]
MTRRTAQPAPPVVPWSTLRSRARWATAIACACAGLITAVLLGAPLLTGGFLLGGDLSHTDLGTLCELKNLLATGQSLWLSPHMGNGGVLLARPSAQLFYPLRWLLVPLPLPWAHSLSPTVHLAIAAATATWLARTFGVHPRAAALSGLVYAWCGVVVGLIPHSYYVTGAAWLPLLWASGRRGLASGQSRWFVLTGMAGALCLLGGEPQSFAVGAGVLLLEVLWSPLRSRRASWRQLLRRGIPVLLALASAAGLGLLQWGAFMVESSLGSRRGVLSADEALFWSLAPPDWLGALWPGEAFSSGLVRALYSEGAGFAESWNAAPYLGGAVLAVVVSVVVNRRGHLATLLVIVSLVAALGSFTPIMPFLIELVPPLGLFRYPQKYLVLTALAASVVVAISVGRARLSSVHRRRLTLALTLLLLSYGLMWAIVATSHEGLAAVASDVRSVPHLATLPPLEVLWSSASIHAMLALLALLILVRLRTWRPTLALLVLWCDVLVAAHSMILRGPSTADLVAPLAVALPPEDIVLCHDPDVSRATFAAFSDDPWWQREVFQRSVLLPERQACDGVRAAIPYSPLITRVQSALTVLGRELSINEARSLACTHIVKAQPVDGSGVVLERMENLPARARAFASILPPTYRIVDAIPRSFVVARPRLASSEAELLQGMARASRASEAVAWIDDPGGRLLPGQVLPVGASVHLASVEWSGADRATMTLVGEGGAVVGLRTSFLIGWTAHQGERSVPVIRVSGSVLGVLVDDASAGPVELRYRSPGFAFFVAAAFFSLLVLGALWLRGGPARQRRTGTMIAMASPSEHASSGAGGSAARGSQTAEGSS